MSEGVANPPILLIDTGALLTLLFANGRYRKSDTEYNPKKRDFSMLNAVRVLAHKNVVRLVTTDMVLTEFLDCDNVVDVSRLSKDEYKKELFSQMPATYGKRSERVTFISEMVRDGWLEVIPTETAQEYTKFKEGKNPHYARKDRGDVSLADAVEVLQGREQDTPIHILYEASDIRGRVIWRLRHSEESQYNVGLAGKSYSKAIPSDYNPNNRNIYQHYDVNLSLSKKGINPEKVHFLSTPSFVQYLMELCVENDTYLFSPNERISPENERISPDERRRGFSIIYEQIVQNVKVNISRSYSALRDHSLTSKIDNDGGFLSYLQGIGEAEKQSIAEYLNLTRQLEL